MGIKGDKLSEASVFTADSMTKKLSSIEGTHLKKMFGGHGIFHDNKMFGLIDSKGQAFIKAMEPERQKFLDKGSVQHSRMPYFSIPLDVYDDLDQFLIWAKEAIAASK